MNDSSAPSDFDFLANAANYIRKDLVTKEDTWLGSPFEWVKALPSGTKGKLGKLLVQQWCALQGLAIGPSPDSEADLMINEHRVEIKFSTLWGGYKFQQIRDQNYEFLICLGVSPFEAHCWVIRKAVLKQHVIGHMGQHTGSEGTETAWLLVKPENPPEWLSGLGGSLEEAYAVLKSLSRKK